ncbi:hypothetical protein BGZ83_011755 [Gryganskiella cystojenkinii]|nr:hypothetical protein BGZ83_011755 [Gryganskiella cystojenkinii]
MTSDTITPKFVNDTTTTFCGMPNCASTTVTLIENTVNQNCLNSTDDYAGMQFIYGAAALYVPLKQGLCQRVPSTPPKINGTFCLTVLTDSLERYIKQHPKIKNWEVFLNATLLQQYIDSMPDSLLCTDCNKSIITPVISYVSVKQLALDSDVVGFVRAIQFAIQRRCGVNFVDGIAPAPSPTTSNPKSQGQGSRSLLLGSGASLLWSLTSGTAVAFLVLTLVNYWWL